VRDMPELLTIDEASDRLRVPVATLYYWRTRGEGPVSARLGRRVVYRASDLADFINQRFAADGSGVGAA
jgi:predicted DNA-binding transcriptional regulator AlpA